MAERQFGPYRLVQQIAVGGMAELHLAKTRGIAGFEKYVALKMIHPNFSSDDNFIEMLIDEAKITVQLQHVNIAQTFDLGRVGEYYYITMEYVDGADLYKLLRRASEKNLDMPVDVAAYIVKEVANGLDYAHRRRDDQGRPMGIVHRDISPQNVLISHSGEVKLVDFGIAKATMKARQTAVGVIKGKYYYMSPEQAWGDVVDHRTDIFSAGILLYESLVGQMLYLEEDLTRLLDVVRKANIAPPTTLRRDIPPQLERIVMNALKARRDDRYQTAGDMATDLERFLHVYSPVFTPAKLSDFFHKVLDDEPPPPTVEIVKPQSREVSLSTQQRIDEEELLRERSEFSDENSIIFRMSELEAKGREASQQRAQRPPSQPGRADAQRAPSQPGRADSQRAPSQPGRAGAQRPPSQPGRADAQRAPSQPGRADAQRPPSQPGRADAQRAPSQPARPGPRTAPRPAPARAPQVSMLTDLDNIEEQTVITGPPGFDGMMPPHMGGQSGDFAEAANMEPTLVGTGYQGEEHGQDGSAGEEYDDMEDAQTLRHESRQVQQMLADVQQQGPTLPGTPARAKASLPLPPPRKSAAVQQQRGGPAHPALSASTPQPAVSELHGARRSRKTPGQGVPATDGQSVLAALVGRDDAGPPVQRTPAPAEPISAPPVPASAPPAMPVSPSALAPGQPAFGGSPMNMPPGAPQAGPMPMGLPPGYDPFSPLPKGSPATFTRQLQAALDLEEIPDAYKIRRKKPRWLLFAILGGVCVVAGVVIGVVLFTRGGEKIETALLIDSVPSGARVKVNGELLPDPTPTRWPGAAPNNRYGLEFELEGYKPYTKDVFVGGETGDVQVKVVLVRAPTTVTLVVESTPAKAEIYLNEMPYGSTPKRISGLDPKTATTLELRLQGYKPHREELSWHEATKLERNITLQKIQHK